MKKFFIGGAVFAVAALMGFQAKAQECDNGVTVYFGLAQKEVSVNDKASLDSLRNAMKDMGINYLELGGHADQSGSDEFNLKLASQREKTVKNILVTNDLAKSVEIKEYNFGESKPKYTSGDAATLGKNRRVEIYYAKLENGKLILRQPSGTTIGIDKSFFAECGLCGSFASVKEIKNEFDAMTNCLSLSTTDGMEYTTSGMVKLNYDCEKQKNPCTNADIYIPAETREEGVQLFEASGTGSAVKWTLRNEEVKYDENAKGYKVNARFCNDVWLSIGKEMPKANTLVVKLPSLMRDQDATAFITQDDEAENLEVTSTNDGFTTRCKDCMSYLTVKDSGRAENGFVYYYEGTLDQALVRTDRKTNYYELTMANYKPKINYSDSVIIVKLPKKAANKVKMHLPALDSSLTVRHYEKSDRLFRLKKPSHDFALTFQQDKDHVYRIEDENLKVKYNKRKKMYFAKIRKKDLK